MPRKVAVAKVAKVKIPSYLEVQFAQIWLDRYPFIDLHSEHRFAPPRRYRLDFAHLPTKIGVELNGGTWMTRSGHSGGTGLRKDAKKYCCLAANGWRVFVLTSDMVSEQWIDMIANAINN
jgi:very-short-patch-repair endonuclease